MPMLLALSLLFSIRSSATVAFRGVQWDPTETRLRCSVYLQSAAQFQQKDLVAEKGLFYIDLYNVQPGTPLEKEMYELNNPFLRGVRFQVWKEQNVLRICFWPQPGVTHKITFNKTSPRLDIDMFTPAKTTEASSPKPTPAATSVEKKVATAKSDSAKPTSVRPVPTIAAKGKTVPQTSLAPEKSKTVAMDTTSGRLPFVSRFMRSAALKTRSSSSTSSKDSSSSSGKKIVVIDAGHGGSRGGATGAYRSRGKAVIEKDINFQIARRLAGLIKKSPNMRYMMTRESDSHVGLWDRVQFAENAAKPGNGECIFVSIHNNWSSNSSAKGIEFYYFEENPRNKSEALKALEDLENDVQYKDDLKVNSTLKNILLSLEQGKIQERKIQGREVCSYLEWAFQQHPYFRNYNRGVKGAGFSVLRNFSMPAVLVEVGFVSNAEECRLLSSDDFQHNAAVGIYNALNVYFSKHDPSFKPNKYDFK